MGARTSRHDETRARLLDAAWELARQRGLTGWSLRELGAAVGMRAPSLYVYFEGKDAIYDAMFAQGYRELRAALEGLDTTGDLPTVLADSAEAFATFGVADPARFQLLFLRVVPGFTPSPTSYNLAASVLERLREVLAAGGIDDPAAVDLWTAILTGLVSQQLSNDPGGDRWTRLLDRAVEMFVATEGPAAQSSSPPPVATRT